MKSKFKFLLSDVFFKHIKTKSFVISNIIIFILVLALSNIQTIINFFGGDFQEAKYIVVNCEATDYQEEIIDDLSANIKALNITDSNYQIVLEEDRKEDMNVIYELNINYANELFTVEKNIYEHSTVTDQIINQAIRETYNDLLELINPNLAASVEKVNNSLVIQDHDLYDEGMDDVAYITSVIMSLIVFMLIMISIQFIGGEIIEEKSSRMIENILANVDAKTHFLSKLGGIILFLLVQVALFVCYGLIAITISASLSGLTEAVGDVSGFMSQVTSSLPGALLNTIPFVVFGFILYSILVALVASMASSMQDYSQFITPITLSLLVGFYMGIFSYAIDGSVIINIFGYIPLFSPILAPLLYANMDYSLINYLLSLAILIVSCYLVYRFTLPIYRVSLLDYSEEKLSKKFKSALKHRKM